VDILFALAFPDVYEVGMSNLGQRILYHTLNRRDDTAAERVFAPAPDMEEMMRQEGYRCTRWSRSHQSPVSTSSDSPSLTN